MSGSGTLWLFIDGSVNTKTKCGYGAYLAVDDPDHSPKSLISEVRVKRFAETTSSQLELQTLLWAFGELPNEQVKVVLYTDSQTIVGLPGRRDRLVGNDFRSANGKHLRHHELYRQFYESIDHRNVQVVKVKGHQPARHKGAVDNWFTLVDRASRKAMKAENI